MAGAATKHGDHDRHGLGRDRHRIQILLAYAVERMGIKKLTACGYADHGKGVELVQ